MAKINVKDNEITIIAVEDRDYISLTDMANAKESESRAADIIKKAGINIGEKITVNAIRKIPGAVLTKINQKVGFRLITKFGEKGAVNLVKLVPLVGGVVGGGIDVVGTTAIAKVANQMFIEGKI